MSNSTVLRVKRRLEDNPQDALVIMCKRIKTDTEEISPSLFVFRGTVDNQETLKVKDISHKNDNILRRAPNVDDIIKKLRKEHKEASNKQRYEVINCSRGLKETNNEDSEDIFDLVDLQKSDETEKGVQFTYDLYMSIKQDFDVSMLDNLVSIENLESELIFGSHRDNGRQTPSSDGDEDDDSNDENNWRNDYPDSEPSSIDEEDMIRAMKRVDIEDDLSSDTGEDKIYDEPPDIFNDDVKRYGPEYAKYKAKVLSEHPDLSNSLIHSVPKDEFDYKDDSDDGFYYGQEEDNEQFKEQYPSDDSDVYHPD
ncbi:hypothetical protein K1T71_002308 [Dendrolimus kikuchii]|uniref:Uncharacterized protein n=1 Tax=Dendrolimus kikuchii TaxID=765133 RepID=A0ACC1DCK5_9NEOP|nr:hypothetical protein K1T71_002308 [Dendrolimus kikuchii]